MKLQSFKIWHSRYVYLVVYILFFSAILIFSNFKFEFSSLLYLFTFTITILVFSNSIKIRNNEIILTDLFLSKSLNLNEISSITIQSRTIKAPFQHREGQAYVYEFLFELNNKNKELVYNYSVTQKNGMSKLISYLTDKYDFVEDDLAMHRKLEIDSFDKTLLKLNSKNEK